MTLNHLRILKNFYQIVVTAFNPNLHYKTSHQTQSGHQHFTEPIRLFTHTIAKLKMDNFIQLARWIDMFCPNHVISNIVTFCELLMLIEDGHYQHAMVCYVLLNDILPAFVV